MPCTIRLFFCLSLKLQVKPLGICNVLLDKPVHCVLQVSTHNMHSSSEDDDMESPFPNDLSLQQVR